MSAGVAIVSTGGTKLLRALRSLRRTEPVLPVYVILNTSSNTWERTRNEYPVERFAAEPHVQLRPIVNTGYVNGSFNAAVRWLRELGHSHACVIQDDVVFSPLTEHTGHLTEWLVRVESDSECASASGLSLACMEALVRTGTPGCWHRSPEEWDAVDLESEAVWRKLCPGPDAQPALYFGSPGSEEGVTLTDWFVKYFVSDRIVSMCRLGPTGFIIPIRVWEAVGGFSESNGIFYDMEYPIVAAMRGFGVVKAVPSVPHIHLHCQSTGFGDAAVGLWGRDLQSFVNLYGRDPGSIAREHGY